METKVLVIETNELKEADTEPLLKSARSAAERAAKELKIEWPITITIFPYARDAIPETGVGGYCGSQFWVQITADMTGKEHPISTIIDTEIPATVFHEMNHARRCATIGYGTTLNQEIISEGIASVYEVTSVPNAVVPWAKYDEKEIEGLLALYRAHGSGQSNSFDHAAWFFGTSDLPKWIGYKLGVYFVQEFLKKNPTLSPIDLIDIKAEEIISS